MNRALFLSLAVHLILASLLIEWPHASKMMIHAGNKQQFDARLTSAPLNALKREYPGEVAYMPDSGEIARVEGRSHTTGRQPDKASASESRLEAKVSAAQGRDAPVVTRGSGRKVEPAPSASNVSEDGIRLYKLSLAREARAYKHFPVMAGQRAWEGEVSIVIATAAGVWLPQVSLSQGSGVELVDSVALEMVSRAVRTAALPDSLRGREFALTLPVRFSLGD